MFKHISNILKHVANICAFQKQHVYKHISYVCEHTPTCFGIQEMEHILIYLKCI